MDLPPGASLRLRPEDERTHPVEAAPSFNESMYVNLFDHERRMGGWFRVGNRPNEGHAEVSCALYFPDGSAGFMFRRPAIEGNARLAAGGLSFEVVEPFARLRLAYEGTICLLARPADMLDPKAAFAKNPIVPCRVALDLYGISPVVGGEKVDAHGAPIAEPPDEAFARAHYEQHVRGEGTIVVGETTHRLEGLGLRDHSWGPRHWQNLLWYRWLPMAFGPDFAMCITIVAMANGAVHRTGVVLRRDDAGRAEYVPIEDAHVVSVEDADHFAVAQTAHVRTREREYVVEGRALSLLPLRNVRTTPDGRALRTRITEAMTEFRCDGHVGYGMSEYLDQLVDGVPAGRGDG